MEVRKLRNQPNKTREQRNIVLTNLSKHKQEKTNLTKLAVNAYYSRNNRTERIKQRAQCGWLREERDEECLSPAPATILALYITSVSN